jgi:iron(III) transport system ATP-binding protein
MDEPLSNLDAKLRIEMRNAIREIQKSVGITTIYVTHDQEEAMAVSDRIAVMDQGIIQHVATPKSLYQRPANLFVANFIGHSNTLKAKANPQEGKLCFSAGYELPFDNFREGAEGGEVVVSVRPEEFIIQQEDQPGIRARVLSSVFLGLNTTYFVCLESGETAEIIEESSISSIIPDGTTISLSMKREKINVFTLSGDRSITKGVMDDAEN